MAVTWAPTLVLGVVSAAGGAATSHGIDLGSFAAVLGGAAAVISAITGLVVALRRQQEPQIVVVTPEQAAEMDLANGHRTHRADR